MLHRYSTTSGCLIFLMFFITSCEMGQGTLASFPESESDLRTDFNAKALTVTNSPLFELTTPLTDPDGLIFGFDINNRNQVLFRANTQQLIGRAFVLEPDETLTEISSPEPADRVTSTASINDLGQVTGSYFNPDSGTRSYTWSPDLGFVPIPTPGYQSNGIEINNNGEIIGTYREGIPGQSQVYSYNWNSTNGFTDLRNETQITSPVAFNDQGMIAGYTLPPYSARTYQLNGTETVIPFPSGVTDSRATSINSTGSVTGWYTAPNGLIVAYTWSPGQSPEDLTSTGFRNTANDINDRGEVAGTESSVNGIQPLFWDTEGNVHYLPTGDYTYGGANGINNEGVVVGYVHNGNLLQSDLAVWVPDNSDNEPPSISLNQHVTSVWPPNHSMRLAVSDIQATDNADQSPLVEISVQSNEPSNGKGDGITAEDFEVLQSENGIYEVYVRAERSGRGSGRVYTINITATDAAGNSSSETLTVSVSKSKRL